MQLYLKNSIQDTENVLNTSREQKANKWSCTATLSNNDGQLPEVSNPQQTQHPNFQGKSSMNERLWSLRTNNWLIIAPSQLMISHLTIWAGLSLSINSIPMSRESLHSVTRWRSLAPGRSTPRRTSSPFSRLWVSGCFPLKSMAPQLFLLYFHGFFSFYFYDKLSLLG